MRSSAAVSTPRYRRLGLTAAVALVAGGCLMLPDPNARPPASAPPLAGPGAGFLEALRAPAPSVAGGGARDLYTPLLGDWEGEVVDHLPDGSDRRGSAEMHFAWVLEGRAIQDLWIAPARRDRPPSRPAGEGNRYGTTLRVYDPALDAWRLTWWNPASGVETRLVGRRVGEEIVQTGADADGRLVRWVFDEVGADRFHWRGETSDDGGRSWLCDTEFFARRRPAPARVRRVAWEWSDRPGLETLELRGGPDGARADGRVVVALEGAPVAVRYRIEHDAGWRFRRASVELGPAEAGRTFELVRDRAGQWAVDGVPRPDLEGCEDLDLMVTPYTNTPPLAARPLAVGESRRLHVAWVRFPGLEVRAVEQEYTRLDAVGGPARYRYRNLESGFVGELTVDGDGVVLDYGPWRRR